MLADAVTAVGFDDGTVVFGGDRRDFFSNVSVTCVWFDYGHASSEALVSALEQFKRFFFVAIRFFYFYFFSSSFAICFSTIAFITTTTDKNGFVQVTVVSTKKRRNIDIHDIPFLQWPTIGNTVTNNFVYAYAARFREAIIIQRRRVRILIANVIVAQRVQCLRRDPRANRSHHAINRSSSNNACLS